MSFTTREVVASTARTTSGNSGALTAGGATAPGAPRRISLGVNASTVSGTSPSLALTVEWSHDGGTTWLKADPADSFTAITAAGSAVKKLDVKGPTYRVVWAITGTTPSFTFNVTEYGDIN